MSEPKVGVPPLEFEDDALAQIEEQLLEPGQEPQVGEPEPETPEPEEELPKEYRNLTKKQLVEQLSEARRSAQSADTLAQAVKELGTTLRVPQAPAAAPPKKDLRKDPAVIEKIKTGLFSENPAEVLVDIVEQIAEEKAQSYSSRILAELAEDKKDKLAQDPLFKKYEAEIQQMYNSLEPQYRANPGALKFVFDQVKARHLDDIVEMRVQEKLQAHPAAKPAPEPQRVESSVAQPAAAQPRKITVQVDPADKHYWVDIRGVPEEEYLRDLAERQRRTK